jgi:hypothetical protein
MFLFEFETLKTFNLFWKSFVLLDTIAECWNRDDFLPSHLRALSVSPTSTNMNNVKDYLYCLLLLVVVQCVVIQSDLDSTWGRVPDFKNIPRRKEVCQILASIYRLS